MPKAPVVAGRDKRRTLFLKMIDDLKKERDDLIDRLAALDAELAEYGTNGGSATGAGRPAGRARMALGGSTGARKGSLKEYILEVAKGQAMSPSEIATAVVASGYKTKSRTLPQSVSVACGDLVKAGLMKKVKRGEYRAS